MRDVKNEKRTQQFATVKLTDICFFNGGFIWTCLADIFNSICMNLIALSRFMDTSVQALRMNHKQMV